MAEAALPVVAAAPARRRPWVRGPAWDSAWMLCALWLAPLVFVLSAGAKDPRSSALDGLFFALTAFFWLAHRASSAWVAYMTTAYAPLRRAHPVRYVVVPLAIAAFCFAAILPAEIALPWMRPLPWTRAQRVMGFVIVDYLLVTYHFASQHFGALSLYRMRAGRAGSRGLRRLDRAYALFVGGALVILAEVIAGTVYFIDVWIDPWLDPKWVESAAGTLRLVGTSIAGVATLSMLAVEARSPDRSWPRALYVLGLGAMVATAFYARTPFVFVVLWSAQHWIVATGLATVVAGAGPAPAARGGRAALHAVNRRPWALLLVLAALSVLLLPFLEVEGADADAPLYAPRLFGEFATALRTSSWVPALVALGLTTALLHYWLDRCVYRFSHAATREAARGLLEAPRPAAVRRPAPAPARVLDPV